jgi:hypothetical protein
MNTQCKSCGSVKFKYNEVKKVCAYCGREVCNNELDEELDEELYDTEDYLVHIHYPFVIIDPTRTISFLSPKL